MTAEMFVSRVVFLCFTIGLLKLAYSKRNYIVILEREEVPYMNSKYIVMHNHSLTKANRTAPYIYNINFTALQPWSYNVSNVMKTYEKRSNEYRESIISFSSSLCDMIQSKNFFLDVAKRFGNIPSKCPLKGNVFIKDMFINEETFPEGFPQSNWKFSWSLHMTDSKIQISRFDLYLRVLPKTSKNMKIAATNM